MGSWKNDLGDSAFDFQRVVWPVISQWMGGGKVVPVESVKDTGFNTQLDILAGIDAWQLCRDDGRMRGIASRVQWGQCPYDTFTIRMSRDSGNETEYSKRRRALEKPEDGWLFPSYTVQAYVSARRSGDLLSVGVVRTRDLFEYIEEHPAELLIRRSNADFIAARWDQMLQHGFSVFTVPDVAMPQFLIDTVDAVLDPEDDEEEEYEPADWHPIAGYTPLFDYSTASRSVDDEGLYP